MWAILARSQDAGEGRRAQQPKAQVVVFGALSLVLSLFQDKEARNEATGRSDTKYG